MGARQVDNDARVLIPAPSAVVVEQDEIAADAVTLGERRGRSGRGAGEHAAEQQRRDDRRAADHRIGNARAEYSGFTKDRSIARRSVGCIAFSVLASRAGTLPDGASTANHRGRTAVAFAAAMLHRGAPETSPIDTWRDWRRAAVFTAVCIAAFAFVPRAWTTGRFATADEFIWLDRSMKFSDALLSGDFPSASATTGARATILYRTG